MGNSTSLENRVRALIVSPAYKGSGNYLECTIEDGKLWYDFLTTKARLPPQCIRWISDWRKYPQVNGPSNMKDIAKELKDVVEWAHGKEKPIIFIAYSGHGTSQRDDNGDEEDGMDEGWVSSDLGFVRDDYLNEQVLARLPKDAFVIAFNDACYNGTVWDTPFTAMYIGKDMPQIKQRARSKMGLIQPVIDDVIANTLRSESQGSLVSLSPSSDTVVQPAQANHKMVWLALLAIAMALVQNAKQLEANVRAIAVRVIALAAAVIALLPRPSTRSKRVAVQRVAVQRIAAIDESKEDALSRYSSGVSNSLNASNGSKKNKIQCTFTGFSSSNDSQVSYEGAKNGFFTYFVHAILKEELVPILDKAQTIEEVFSSWRRTGYSLVNECGSKLNRMGLKQYPIWQVNTSQKMSESTTVFLQ